MPVSPRAAGCWKLGANSRAKIVVCLPVLPLGQHLGQDMGLEELLTLAGRALLMLLLLPEGSELSCLPYLAMWNFVAHPLTQLESPQKLPCTFYVCSLPISAKAGIPVLSIPCNLLTLHQQGKNNPSKVLG